MATNKPNNFFVSPLRFFSQSNRLRESERHR